MHFIKFFFIYEIIIFGIRPHPTSNPQNTIPWLGCLLISRLIHCRSVYRDISRDIVECCSPANSRSSIIAA